MKRSGFASRRPPAPRPDRSEEFASFVPRARPPAPRQDLSAVRLAFEVLDPLEPALEITVEPTPAERAYMGRVAERGCLACRLLGYGATPAQVHHLRDGKGAAQRGGHFSVIPLCREHHQGTHGVHGDRGVLRQLGMTEMDLLDYTIGESVA